MEECLSIAAARCPTCMQRVIRWQVAQFPSGEDVFAASHLSVQLGYFSAAPLPEALSAPEGIFNACTGDKVQKQHGAYISQIHVFCGPKLNKQGPKTQHQHTTPRMQQAEKDRLQVQGWVGLNTQEYKFVSTFAVAVDIVFECTYRILTVSNFS